MPNELTLDQVRAMAADIGLNHLSDGHLEQLLRSTRLAHARRASLRSGTLVPADEPSHVFRLGAERVR